MPRKNRKMITNSLPNRHKKNTLLFVTINISAVLYISDNPLLQIIVVVVILTTIVVIITTIVGVVTTTNFTLSLDKD